MNGNDGEEAETYFCHDCGDELDHIPTWGGNGLCQECGNDMIGYYPDVDDEDSDDEDSDSDYL